MAKVRNLDVGALQGIHLHDGFLGEETLLRLIQHDGYKSAAQGLMNEKLRAFRTAHQEFARNIERLQKKNKKAKIQGLISEWITTTLSYLGYDRFEKANAKHWEEGKIAYLCPIAESHSVAVFVSASIESVSANIHDRVPLTSFEGAELSTSSRKETLCEQVEKAIGVVGVAEALLITPNAAYYLRADSQVSGQCLECRWDEMLVGDNDSALALATYLLRSDFFAFNEAAVDATSEEQEEESAEDEEAGSGGVATKLTKSSELFRENLDQAREITEDLHKQVVLALEILINERLAIDPELKKESVKAASNERISHGLFKDGLFILYRILFVLYAESRGFLPLANRRFSSFYSMEHLRDWSEDYLRRRNRGTADQEGTYIWHALSCIFTLLRRGVGLPGGEQVSPYNGQLFAPDRAPYFDLGPALRDDALATVITALTRVGGDSSARRLHFANLGVEQLGAVYEALLAQKPIIITQPSCWVPAHGDVVGLVTIRVAEALEMSPVEDVSKNESGRQKRREQKSGKLEKFIDPRRPAFNPSNGKFVVAPLGGQKRQTASFYTPPKLAEFLVKRTLRSLAEGKSSKEILGLRVVEPAMGSGGFLIQVVRYLADQLLRAKIKERSLELRSGERPSFIDLQRCKREVVENCIFGVDVNPLAIELARTSLYLEALVPGEPLPFLHHRLKSGNSLIGADIQNRAQAKWEEGVVFPMLFELPLDHIKVDEKLWAVWDSGNGKRAPSSRLKAEFEGLRKRVKVERKKIGAESWASWANEMQQKVNELHQLTSKAHQDFERNQVSNDVIDQIDGRYKDQLALIPDMDPVLIEANEVEVDPAFLQKRKAALLNELGQKAYKVLVQRQRAYTRLKALGDLHTALWYWPLDGFSFYPSYEDYKGLITWLLDTKSLVPGSKQAPLSKNLRKILRTALAASRRHGTLNWQIEFPTVFADASRTGFDAVISNPPWKSIGIVDRDFYPHFDPQFLDTKPAKKAERIKKLVSIYPEIPGLFADRVFAQNRIAEHWRSGALSDTKPKGQLDYCIAFSLLPSRLLREKGRAGLIVSRPAIFVSKNAVSVREYFFREGGLREAINFVNRCLMFDIAPHMEFSVVVTEQQHRVNPSLAPTFLSGLADPNVLNMVQKALDDPSSKGMVPGCFPVQLTEKDIRACFSPKNLVVPQLRHQKEIDIARALVEASGPTIKLDKLKGYLKRGIDHSSGPSGAEYKFSEDLSSNSRTSVQEILGGTMPTWVPLCRGRDFNLFDPLVDVTKTTGTLDVNEYVKRSSVDDFFDLAKATFVWRGTGGKNTNKRSPVCTLLPPGLWADHNVWGCQPSTLNEALGLLCIFGSIPIDFFTGLISFSNVSKGVALALPIPIYKSNALNKAIEIAMGLLGKVKSKAPYWKPIDQANPITNETDREKAQAKIDALVWLHFGMNRAPLNRENLEWVLNNHFPILSSTNPNYKTYVLQAYDEFSSQAEYSRKLDGEMFQRVAEPIPITTPRGDQSESTPSERRKSERRLAEKKSYLDSERRVAERRRG